jgi:hypothetical protein
LLGIDKPFDPKNDCFERSANKLGGGDGRADVWKRTCFDWERFIVRVRGDTSGSVPGYPRAIRQDATTKWPSRYLNG